MFGHHPQQIFRAPISRVKSNDPDSREKYSATVLETFESKGVFLSFKTLEQYCNSQCQGIDIKDEIEHLHEELSAKMQNICSEVDSNLFQFFTGTTPWSPQIQVHRDQIDYWHAILRIKTVVLTIKNNIKRLSIKLGKYSGHYLNAEEALQRLKDAWKEYRAVKKAAHTLQEAFLEELIAKKAIDCKVTDD